MLMSKRLIAYGCSQTAALETNDSELMPELEHVKKQYGAMHFLQEVEKIIPNFNIQEYIDKQKQNSYANLLAFKLGIDCINRSEPGDSNSAMLWKIDRDIANDDIKNNDLIIIGITTRERALYFGPRKIKSIMLGYPDTWDNRIFHKSFLNYYNPELNAFDLSKNLRSLLYIEKTKLPNRLFFVETHPFSLNIELSDWEKKSGITPITDYAQIVLKNTYEEIKMSGNILNDRKVSLVSGLGQKQRDGLAGGHAPKQWHTLFAEHLFKNIKEISL
jgi:hypothetical protein